jgi:hypothetical protein
MKRIAFAVSAGVAVIALACGGDDPAATPATAHEPVADSLESADPFSDEDDFGLDSFESAASENPSGLASVRFSPDPPVPGEPLRAMVSMQRGSGKRAELSYIWSIAGHRVDNDRGSIQLPKLEKHDRIEVSVARSDGVGDPVTAVATIENSRPKLMELKLELEDTADGEVWKAEAWGNDPDGDTLEYEYTWIVNGRRHKHKGATFPSAELERGDTISVRVVASDGEEDSSVAESGRAEVANAAPDFVSTPPPLDRSGQYRYEAKAEDPDDDRGLKYELVEGPEGMEMDSRSGVVSWTPSAEQAGRHTIEIAVEDKHDGRSTQSWILPVVITTEYGESPAALP